jgi:DNA-directed RNA polymerase specialized sigma24 family protein
MPADGCPPVGSQPLDARCRAVVERLTALYGWRLDAAGRAALVRGLLEAHADDAAPVERAIEQTCCRLHFAALSAALERGGEDAGEALAELFSVRLSDESGNAVARYSGYLFRSALLTLRRRLGAGAIAPVDREQLAADAAGRALTTVGARFRDCRDPDSFWGWTARVAERATIDELRSGSASGGRSLHAASLDEEQELHGDRSGTETNAEERQVDAISVRQELLRKCRLGKLSLDQRDALVRSFWGGEKPQEIAAALSTVRGSPVTAAQVSLWKHRGLLVMEANLRGRGYG